jgi:hypothetical protein
MQMPQLELQNCVPGPQPNGGASGRGPSRRASGRDASSTEDSILDTSSREESIVASSESDASSLGETLSRDVASSAACASRPASVRAMVSSCASPAPASGAFAVSAVEDPPHAVAATTKQQLYRILGGYFARRAFDGQSRSLSSSKREEHVGDRFVLGDVGEEADPLEVQGEVPRRLGDR